MNKARSLGCICCILDGYISPFEVDSSYTAIHHLYGKTSSNAHFSTIPLCSNHHQHGDIAVHRNKTRFEAKYGSQDDLLVMVKDMISYV